MGAGHLSCCLTLLHLDHRPEERRLMSWSITEEKREEKRIFSKSFPPVGDSQKSKRVFCVVYAWLGVSVKVATFFCHQVGQIWSYRAVFVSGILSPTSSDWAWFRSLFFQMKRKSWICVHVGIKNQTKTDTCDEVCRTLVP